ncbi:helix-turn-helix domain-containing protein [Natrialba swarupiae]|nr:helix-turn-helix domain-containing protein [Natrialba swarupiae]MCW8173357.1 helix-turn-helix domain-containing protein [Natrialba swarupiae]
MKRSMKPRRRTRPVSSDDSASSRTSLGDTDKMAARRVGASQPTGGRWLKAWNEGGVDGLRPSFAGGRPRSSPLNSLTSSLHSSKTVNRGHHRRSTIFFGTDTA